MLKPLRRARDLAESCRSISDLLEKLSKQNHLMIERVTEVPALKPSLDAGLEQAMEKAIALRRLVEELTQTLDEVKQ